MEPQSIAHYRITGKLGEGGMGAVYRATDTKLARDVAIKVLPDAFANDAHRLMRFTREAQVLASLNHPNIAGIYGIEERAIVMELVEGPTLEAHIHRGPLPLEEIVVIARQIAEALEAAHEKGIVHRDLKPANVKLTLDGQVKVLDFGLAKLSDPRELGENPAAAPTVIKGHSPTIAGMILGTAGYMSPEQAAGQAVDRRADIWAFGAVLWEMLCGTALFNGETVTHTIADVMRAEIDLKRLPPEAPSSIRALVGRCLERDLKKRLQAIGEARIVLEQWQADPTGSIPPVPRDTRSTRWLWIAVTALTLLLAASVRWRWQPAGDIRLMQFEINLPTGLTLPPLGSTAFELSPSGDRLAFLGRAKDGKTSLWIRGLDANTATPLAGTDRATHPFWSPDGRFIAFFANGRLQRINVNGGVPQLIAESDGAGGTWNTDGVILYGGRFDLSRKQIMRVPASGGTPSAVLALDTANGETMQGNPFFLPDGRHFLYQSYTRKAPELVFASLDGSIRKRLFAHSSSPVSFVAETTGTGAGWLLFVSQNRLFAQPFDSSKGSLKGERQLLADSVFNGPSWSAASNGLLAVWHNQTESNQLQWLNRDGSLVETIGDPGAFFSPRLSPEGRLIVYQKDREIWLHDTTRKIASRVTEEWASRPMWSPDGKTILYDTVRDGSRIAVARHANGAGGERLLYKKDGTATGGVVGLSRDEKWAVLFENLALHFQHLGDGRMVRFPETAPSIGVSLSPDSRWLVYSVISSVQREVFVQSVPVDAGGSANAVGRFQISNAGGTQPVWRSDGKEIFYISLDGRMMAVGVESGADFFRPGPAKPLFQTRVSANNWSQYDVTPDGRRFLIAQPAEGSKETPISVIVNWTRLLTKP